jgi:threonine/homoserine/homoserine lactone efflux protein
VAKITAMDLLPPSSLLWAFMAASLALALTPGPAVVYIVARTLAQGRASGLASAVGVALGNFGNALGATFGLALLFAVSSAAFTAVKLAGAVYLVWMGLAMWREAGRYAATTQALPSVPRRRTAQVFRDGFAVALLNPKTALFFAAFLPQFISAPAHATAQSVALGAVFVAIAASTDIGYVLLAASVAPRLRGAAGARRVGQRVAGSAFIGLGLLAAVSGKPVG